MFEFEVGCVDQVIEKDRGLNIFEQTTKTNELVKEFVGRELHIFKRYQVDINDSKCPS
jgi:hypothetical protein